MKNLDETAELIARKITLDKKEVAQRKAFLEITDADIALLQYMHEQLQAKRHTLMHEFRQHLLGDSSLFTLLSEPGKLERLVHDQSSYFSKLTEGVYDVEYVEDRLRAGIAYQGIGLESKWYVGACRKYLSLLMPVLWQLSQGDAEKFLPVCDALLKVIFLDMALVLDTYAHADSQEILQIKRYAEQIITSMPTGLMVLDTKLGIRSMNRAMCRMFGLSADNEVIGMPLSTLIPNHQLHESLEQLRADGGRQHKQIVALHGQNGIRRFEFNVSGALLEQENLLLVMAQDITESLRSQEELRRFRMALDSSIDAIYLIDYEQMRFIDANETASTTLGYTHQELMTMGPDDLKPDEGERERIDRRFEEVIRSESKTGMVRTVHQRKDGTRLPVEVYLRAVVSEGRQLLVAVVRDISARLKAEVVLRESEERFRAAFNQAAVGLAHVAPDGRWLMANRKLCEIVGYSQKELVGMSFQEITHPEDLITDKELARRMMARELDEKTREKRYRHKNGYYIWVNLTSSLVRDENGEPKYYSTVVEDISRRKQIEEELLHLASHDALTHLPNRSLLLDRLSQALAYANRSSGQVAIMLIDLDRFKNINDSLGHDVGDKIIMEVGRRLSSMAQHGDTIARVGGDEFAVVLPDVTREETVAMLAQQTLESLSQPMTIQGHEFYPTGSIGISLYPKDGHDSQALLKNADTAMYRAKDAGRNNFQFYASEMNARALDRLKLESGLRRALERGEFVLHYQPQVDIVTGGIVGVEALLRWAPPGQPVVFPVDFIPIAEETGLIMPIGEWVLRTACTQNKAWQTSGRFPKMKVAVNLSARQFKQQDIVKMVSRVLSQTGCDASSLELEITESVIMEDPEAAAQTLQNLSDMGVHLSIDDFGTGYSSLSYLKRFPINSLKIDRSFVRDITIDADDAAIAKAVIALAHSLKLQVIAEGVETAEQMAFLREQRCDQIQGYYLSRPLAVEELEQLFLKRWA